MASISLADFAKRILQIMPVIAKEFARSQSAEIYRGKITFPQLFVLEFLSRQGSSNMTCLADFMKVSTASMTGIVERLVRQGYTHRSYGKEDRRVIKIQLTAKGADFLARTNEKREKAIINIFGKISENDREDYLRILTRIKDILDRQEQG